MTRPARGIEQVDAPRGDAARAGASVAEAPPRRSGPCDCLPAAPEGWVACPTCGLAQAPGKESCGFCGRRWAPAMEGDR